MLNVLSKLWHEREFRKIIVLFVIYKTFVISIAIGTQFFVPAELTHTQKITDNLFLNPFAQYDATVYLDVAENGYRSDFGEYKTGNYHWYPLYPLLIRLLGFIGYPLAAFLISNVASFLAIIVLYLLVKEELGKGNAYKTIFYAMLFPTAFYFTMMYTESLFLLLSLLVFYYAKRCNWLLVGVIGFFTALTRSQGILLLLPALIIYLRSINFKFSKYPSQTFKNLRKLDRYILYLLLLPVGTFTFMIYEFFVVGDLFAQFKSAVVFGKYLTWPWESFGHSIISIFLDTTLINVAYHIYTLFIVLSFLILTCLAYKKLRFEYFIYLFLTVIPLLFLSNLLGTTRYFLVAFPAFMTLSMIDDTNKFIKYGLIILYTIFVFLMAGFIMLHVTQRINSLFFYTPLF